MRISVGSLPQTLNEEALKKMFAEFGSVEEVVIKRDKKTQTSLGYGHVDMPDDAGKKAIEKLNGKEIEDKKIAVVDAAQLQNEGKDKNWDKPVTNSKIHGTKFTGGGFTGGGVRKSGGGGRGK